MANDSRLQFMMMGGYDASNTRYYAGSDPAWSWYEIWNAFRTNVPEFTYTNVINNRFAQAAPDYSDGGYTIDEIIAMNRAGETLPTAQEIRNARAGVGGPKDESGGGGSGGWIESGQKSNGQWGVFGRVNPQTGRWELPPLTRSEANTGTASKGWIGLIVLVVGIILIGLGAKSIVNSPATAITIGRG